MAKKRKQVWDENMDRLKKQIADIDEALAKYEGNPRAIQACKDLRESRAAFAEILDSYFRRSSPTAFTSS